MTHIEQLYLDTPLNETLRMGNVVREFSPTTPRPTDVVLSARQNGCQKVVNAE